MGALRRRFPLKQATLLAILLGIIVLLNLWIFLPQSLDYFDNLWHLLGKPDRGTRALYVIPVVLFILITSGRVFRRGPL